MLTSNFYLNVIASNVTSALSTKFLTAQINGTHHNVHGWRL